MFNLKRRVLLKAALHPGSRRLLWRGLEVRSPPACSPLEEAAPASASSWAAGNWPVTTTLQTFPLTCGATPPTYSFFFFLSLSSAHTTPLWTCPQGWRFPIYCRFKSTRNPHAPCSVEQALQLGMSVCVLSIVITNWLFERVWGKMWSAIHVFSATLLHWPPQSTPVEEVFVSI